MLSNFSTVLPRISNQQLIETTSRFDNLDSTVTNLRLVSELLAAIDFQILFCLILTQAPRTRQKARFSQFFSRDVSNITRKKIII